MAGNAQGAFSAAVSRLDELSGSELRQLYLIIGVRLGYPDGKDPNVGSASAGIVPARGGRAAAKRSGGPRRGAKGNPGRKSQWANHPLYIEYSRLKKTVERQAKEAKTSFNAVRTDEARQYRTALSQWLEAKSSFRGRNTTKEDSSDEESDREEEQKAPPAQKGKERSAPSPPRKTGPPAAGSSSPVEDWAEEVTAAEQRKLLKAASDAKAGAGPSSPAPPAKTGGSRQLSSSPKPEGKSSPPQKGVGSPK